MRHNASFIASNTHSESERTELPHIQQYLHVVCLSTKIYDNQSQHLTLYQLPFEHEIQSLFC